MNILRAKAGRPLGAAVLVLALTACAANAWGGDGCVSFQATTQGSFFVSPPVPAPPLFPTSFIMGWAVEGYFTIGQIHLRAMLVYPIENIVEKKTTQNVFQGIERATAYVQGGGTFDLVSHFTAPHQKFGGTEGVSILNESGTIENGTGRFVNISGHFTNHGIYGPAVAGISTEPNAVMGVTTNMNGNICGVNLSVASMAVGK